MTTIELRVAALALAALGFCLSFPSLRVAVGWILVAILMFALRSPALGGHTTLAFVSGVSMEPSLHTGDLVLLVRQTEYEVGDIVAYNPSQASHGTIIHRIVGRDAGSRFVIRGDNRSTDDYDRPASSQLLGRALVVLPSVGWFFAGLRIPVLLGFVVALVAMWVAWDLLFEPKKEEGLT